MNESRLQSMAKWLIFGVIAFAAGAWMMIDPAAMEGMEIRGRNSMYKQLLAWVWGYPAGFALVVAGPALIACAFLKRAESDPVQMTTGE
jgi:hypothetical protein